MRSRSSRFSHTRVFRLCFLVVCCVCVAVLPLRTVAEPLSKKIELDFFREIPSRNLHGLASRSDGRLVAGPVLTELAGAVPADLLWSLAPAGNNTWLIGTGPDSKILEATLDPAKNAFTTRDYAKLDEPHIFALAKLADGSVLAGTSPNGGLFLLRDGKVVASIILPVDSIFDILELSPSKPETQDARPNPAAPQVLIATGNPARIYQINAATFAAAGIDPVKVTDAKRLSEKGISLFGEVRDRNVRRLARLGDAVVAGSSPKGNIYRFPLRAANAPQTTPVASIILQENREAEVTSLLPQANGDLFVSLVFTAAPGDARINSAPKPPVKEGGTDTSPLASLNALSAADRFSGRSSVVYFPANRFPETITSRSNVAFYQLARSGDTLLIAGGEQGEILGYDLNSRLALTFAGSTSSQLNGLAPVPGADGKFLLLRNNAPGLAVLDFKSKAERSVETRRLDLAMPATFGAFRFSRLRDVAPNQLTVEIKTSFGSDEIEGWTPWTPLTSTDPADPAWRAADLRGRYAKLRVTLRGDSAPSPEIDKAEIYFLPQNRRPLLQEFRLLSPNLGVLPASEPSPSFSASLSQLISNSGDDDANARKRGKSNFLSSQVVPAPGTQVALWTVTDPDNDNLAVTFSIRREDQSEWSDLAVASREPFVQFETSRLTDGVYFTRLVATELAPRPAAERQSVTFETDKLIVDHTPPAIVEATAKSSADRMTVSVHGRDALSLLDSIEVVFNNGYRETLDQPADGIRDGREETFTLEVPIAKVAGANAAEVTLYDDAGNATTRRLTW